MNERYAIIELYFGKVKNIRKNLQGRGQLRPLWRRYGLPIAGSFRISSAHQSSIAKLAFLGHRLSNREVLVTKNSTKNK